MLAWTCCAFRQYDASRQTFSTIKLPFQERPLKPSTLISKLNVYSAIAMLALSTVSLSSISHAQPAPAPATSEMSCAIGVVTGKDVLELTGDTEPTTTTQVTSLPIIDGEGDQEFQINGQTVAVIMYKKQYVDLYDISILLLTPKADLPARGPQVNAVINDYLVNEGPAKNNGWTIKPGPGATKFEYLMNQGGSFAFTNKLQQVLKAEGKWGTYPYTSMTTHSNNMYGVAEEVKELLKAGKLAESDVLGIYTAFSCTLNN